MPDVGHTFAWSELFCLMLHEKAIDAEQSRSNRRSLLCDDLAAQRKL